MSHTTTIALISPAVGEGHNVGDHFIDLAIRRFFDRSVAFRSFTIRRPLNEAEIDEINACACALLCGTNLYQEQWPSGLTLANLEAIRVPVIPFGVGSSAASFDDRALGPTTVSMIRALHDRCTAGSVRDPHTAEMVASLGVRNVIMTGCPVLYWAQSSALPPVRPIRRRRIVVTVRNWLMHRWPDAVDHPVQVKFLEHVFAEFADHSVVLAIHEDYDARLVGRLNIPRASVFERSEPADYVSLYTDPENVILANRLHAGMLALASGVPAVFVGHDTRTYSFCEMVGLGYVPLFDADAAAKCVQRIRRILEGEVSEFAVAAERFPGIGDGMREFLSQNGLPGRWSGRQTLTAREAVFDRP